VVHRLCARMWCIGCVQGVVHGCVQGVVHGCVQGVVHRLCSRSGT
jgi:hypothetical protein